MKKEGKTALDNIYASASLVTTTKRFPDPRCSSLQARKAKQVRWHMWRGPRCFQSGGRPRADAGKGCMMVTGRSPFAPPRGAHFIGLKEKDVQ